MEDLLNGGVPAADRHGAPPLLSDARTEYVSWLVVPMRVSNPDASRAYFGAMDKYSLTLSDLTIKARAMFEDSPSAIGACWRISYDRLLTEVFSSRKKSLPANQFTVEMDGYNERINAFHLFTSWVFVFHDDFALLCLGIRETNPLAAFMISNFGLEEELAVVRHEGTRVSFQTLLLKWARKRLGLVPFFDSATKKTRTNRFFSDSCLFNTAFRSDRFIDLKAIEKAVRNLHLGLRVNDPRDDLSEEDLAYVYGVRNLEMDVPGHEGQGSYRWGCCVTSQTLNYLYGGVDLDEDLTTSIERYAMEGLPLMAIALEQRYTCFMLIERLNAFSSLSASERERLQERMTEFIAYGTFSASAISRWNNIKRIYGHLIGLMDIEDAVKDITRKLDALIAESDARVQKSNESTNRILSLFGVFAIPASIIELIRTISGGAPLWEKACALGVPLLLGGMFLLLRLKGRPAGRSRRKAVSHSKKKKTAARL